jgi:hypothetical protein
MNRIEFEEYLEVVRSSMQYMSIKDKKETEDYLNVLKASSKFIIEEDEPEAIEYCAIGQEIDVKNYNEKEATQLINKYLRRYRIRIVQWSKSSCGFAYYKKDKDGYWRIKVPKPTTIDRFAVVMHEIYHCIDSFFTKPSYLAEFKCDNFALDALKEMGLDTTDWKKRMKWHTLANVAMATNRGHKNVNKAVQEFYPDVDFESWYGKKVFAYIDAPKGVGEKNPTYWDYLRIDIS